MRVLYLDTSSSFLYCGLVDDNSLVFQIKENYGKNLSKNTLYRIEKEFKENNISTKSVDKIILVNGPGSFTGIRIAVTIAKTYAWALNIPIVTISSLQAMAISCDTDKEFIVPIIDARRGYVFGAIYDNMANVIVEDNYILLDQLGKSLEKFSKNYVFVSNDNFEFKCLEYSPDINKIVNKCMNYPQTLPHLVNANYLKLTEAEEKKNDKGI